ncbi:unnamed protein product [Lactuca saligna]|uniref:Uncharacterized protein n=1 Tax=Lactuca saligna TaxID=75948 RepID=A0AA35YEQ0_LACSI|nr:unnamed protein product [Lactuca saligna]
MLDASGSRRKKLRLTDLISLGDFLKIIDIVKVAIGLPGDNGFRRQWVVFLVVTVENLEAIVYYKFISSSFGYQNQKSSPQILLQVIQGKE